MIDSDFFSDFEHDSYSEFEIDLATTAWSESEEPASENQQSTVGRPALSVDTSFFPTSDIGHTLFSPIIDATSSGALSIAIPDRSTQHPRGCR